jgi:phospholipid/cholesterol/gamma-HCH transport system substrate-binding protein
MLSPQDKRRRSWALPRFDDLAGRRILGVLVIVGVFGVIVLAAIRPNPFKQTQTIRVAFNSAQGLGSIDRNVRVAGVNVGTIGSVSRDGDDAVMELEIDPDIPVHSDAIAALRPHTLFEGSDFVELQPGSPSAPPLEGGVIPKSQTRVYVSLDQATRVLRASNRETLRTLFHDAAKVLRGGAVTGLRRTLKAAPQLTKELGPTARALQGPHGDELAGAVLGMSKTVSAVASREQDLAPLIQRANHTVAALNVDSDVPLDATLAVLPAALQELTQGGPQLSALIDQLDRLAVNFRPAMLELAPTLREARPVIRQATPVTVAAVPLIAELRVITRRVAAAAPTLTDVIERVNPGNKILARSVVPFLHSRSRLGMPVYLQLISALTGATGAERPYQNLAQNPNGAGHLLRLGSYFDQEASLNGFALPSCPLIAALSPSVAAQMQAAGLCNP